MQSFILFTLVYISIARGYVMHSSCDYMKATLEKNIQKAFLSADNVSIQFGAKPMDPDIEKVAELVYGSKVGPYGNKAWAPAPMRIKDLQVLRYRREYDTFMNEPESWSTQLVIYCDFKHLVPVTYKDNITQSDTTGYKDPWYFYSSSDELYKNCNSDKPPTGTEVTIGYTTLQDAEYIDTEEGTKIKGGPSQVTKPDVLHLCAWYLKRPGGKQFLDPTNAEQKASRAVIDPVRFPGNKTQVDILSGFSQFLLREFSHSRAIGRGAAEDRLNDKAVPKPGWVQTVQSRRFNNTYNFGYMGIGVQTVLKSGFKITDDGSVVLKVQPSGGTQLSGVALATGVPRMRPRWQPKQAAWQAQRAG